MKLFTMMFVAAMALLGAVNCSKDEGEVVLITGASSGIGYETARVLAKSGYRVVLTARRESKLDAAVKQIQEDGGVAFAQKLDITQVDQWENAITTVEKEFGAIKHFFLNAGIFVPPGAPETILQTDYEDWPPEHWNSVVDINMKGTYLGFQQSIKTLKRNGGGSITNCGSMGGSLHSGYLPFVGTGMATYMISKSTGDHFVQQMAGAYAKHGIRMYGLKPNVYQTELASPGTVAADEVFNGFASVFNMFFKHTFGNPVHIGHIVKSFIDGSTKWKSGQNVICDGDATFSASVQYDVIEDLEFAAANAKMTEQGPSITYPGLEKQLRAYDGSYPYVCREQKYCDFIDQNYPDVPYKKDILNLPKDE